MARGRTQEECEALYPLQVNLAEALQRLTNDIVEFESSAITTGFLSPAATQKALIPPVNNFLSKIDSIQSDFIGDSTNFVITIDDARVAIGEHRTIPPARQIALKQIIEDTQQITASHHHKLATAYEEVIAVLRNSSIEGEFENILFTAVIKYLQAEKNIRKTKITKVFANLADKAGRLIQENTPASPPAALRQPERESSGGKYRLPELSAPKLLCPCTPFEFIEWSDTMLRWLEGASKQFTFNECLGIVFGKLHEQNIPAVNDYLKSLDEDKRSLEEVFACLEKKIWEFHPRIKRIRNCMELKRRAREEAEEPGVGGRWHLRWT